MRRLERLWRWSERPIETLGGSAFIIALAGVASRVLGFIRDRLLASSFGAGDVLDAYYAAFRLPDLVYGFLVLGALSAAFIPVFTELMAHDEKERAWRLAQGVLQWLVVVLGGSAFIGIIFAETVAAWIAPGFSPEKQVLVAQLTRIMLLSPVFLAVSAVFGGVLVSFKQFLAYSFAPIFYNLGIIFGIVLLYPLIGPAGLAIGVVFGSLLHAAVQFPAFRRSGYRFTLLSFAATRKDPTLHKVVRLMIPRSLAVAVSQLSLVIVTVFSSTLVSGSLAAFTLAINIQSIPLGLFGIAFSLASFPVLSTLAAKRQDEEFFSVFARTARRILYFVIPFSLLFIIFRAEIVRIVLGTGVFNWEDTILTFTVLGWLSASLFAQSLIPLFVRAFFALQDTKTPLFAALFSELVHISLILFLLPRFAIAGIAIAFSVGAITNVALLYFFLRRRVVAWRDWDFLSGVGRILGIALIAAVVAQYSKGIFALTIDRLDTFLEVAVKLGVGTVIGVATYISFSALLALPEYVQVKRFIWCRLLRRPETVALTEDHPEKGDW
ncbi:MAG: murein biosynthesis integral membrane protein MurJ [Candidatus Moraniibacteriota bacterium]